jgi:hypothetical protein
MTKDDEIAALKARVAELERADLFRREPWRKNLLASPTELKRLAAIVSGAYPTLGDIDEQSFAVAFAYVSTRNRLEQPDDSRYIYSFAEAATAWAFGANVDIRSNVFLAACIAAGDVAFRVASNDGVVPAVGLDFWGSSPSGRPPSPDSWRAILAGTARLRQSTPVPVSRQPRAPSQIQIIGGGFGGVGAGPAW